jgi:hypothetical protein
VLWSAVLTTRGGWRRLERAWARPWSVWAGGWLTVAAAVLLFLDAAGTLEAAFTVRPSYLLLAAANVVALPWVARGWSRLPASVTVSAAALVAVYVIAAVADSRPVAVPGLARTSHRELAFLADLVVGVGTIGLIVGLRSGGWPLRRLVWALLAGLVLAVLYAAYQWPAQHFGWPLADINSAPNSDNFSTGHRYQGAGVFGWERVRGTFKEPLFLAAYVAALLPFLVLATVQAGPRIRRPLAAGLVLAVAVFALTASSLAWGVALLLVLTLAVVWAVAFGRPRPAAVLGGLLAAGVLAAPVVFVNASVVAGATGRSGRQLQATVAHRRDAWRQVGELWSAKPVLGRGPGHSSIALAYRPDPAAVNRTAAPRVLGSAQGVWAAALLDAGLVGLAAWLAALVGLFVVALRSLLGRAEPLAWAAFAAAGIATLLGQVAGDRFDLKVWVLLGLLAAASQPPGRQAADHRHEADASPQKGRRDRRTGHLA